jgi:hypothetical protein
MPACPWMSSFSTSDPRFPEPKKHEYMHLHADEALLTYFDSIRDLVDTAGLADLDPYGERVWTPDEAGPMADRLLPLYQAVAAATATKFSEPSLQPPVALGRETVLDFLFWLRKIFIEAGHRRMYVLASGD